MDDANPTARALRCLELLQDQGGLTADRLARALGVSDRAARRYVSILRRAGIPIEAVRGPYGGYRLGRGPRPAPLRFTSAEALGLVMAVLDGHHDASDVSDPVGSALGKLVRALPESVAAQPETMRRTAAPVPDRTAAPPDPGTAVTLVGACADHRRVHLDYRTEAGSAWSVEVDPWAVVVRHGRWYLLCWSHAAQDRRVLRVDRVGAVRVLEVSFDRSPSATGKRRNFTRLQALRNLNLQKLRNWRAWPTRHPRAVRSWCSRKCVMDCGPAIRGNIKPASSHSPRRRA